MMKKIAGKKPNIIKELAGRLFFFLPQIPSYVQVGITNKCNFNCKMCPRAFLNVPYKDMDFELFKKIVARLNGVYEINLSSWGETLLHPRIFEMIKYCKDLGFKTDFTSNGSLLSPSVADKLIKAGLDRISFSIDTLKPGSS